MNALTPLAVSNADVLRAIDKTVYWTVAALAEDVGRDPDNLRKSLKAMQAANLLNEQKPVPSLTDAGKAVLAAIERAENPLAADAGPAGFVELYHAQITPDPANARRDWDSDEAQEDLSALASSIEADGLLHPLIVGPADDAVGVIRAGGGPRLPMHYLIGGERRWRAIRVLIEGGVWPEGRKIPCRIRDDEGVAREFIALADNLQRRALNPLEEAKAFKRLRDQDVETAEIARRVGVTTRQVQMRLQLLELSEEDQARLVLPKDDPDYLSPTAARELVQQKKPGDPSKQPSTKAPERPELGPKEALILAELADAAEVRGKDKGFARVVKVRAQPPLGRLEELGYCSSGYDAGPIVTLTMAGRSAADALKHPLGAPAMHLTNIRRDAGIGEVEIAALAEGEYVTPWLNLPKPPPPPEPLSPEQTVALMEIALKARQENGAASISPDFPDWLQQGRCQHATSISVPSVWNGGQTTARAYLYGVLPSLKSPEEFKAALDKARDELDAERAAALKEGEWMTPWLNGGPWPIPEDIRIEIEEREAEKRAEVEAERNRQANVRVRAAQIRHLEELNSTTPSAGDDFLKRLLGDHPLPWRFVERERWGGWMVVDAKGDDTELNAADDLVARCIVVAVNGFAGLATPAPELPPQTTPDDQDEEA